MSCHMSLKSLQNMQKGFIFSLENALVDSITSYIVCVCVCVSMLYFSPFQLYECEPCA